ncbi:hypothetical protein [Sphingomonas sp.]|uniref:hypothetical protein n=2 Tax=Sphingomonas TaxID=13687 RepID=UPI00286F5552|nr:hypothetical protein [Sphingomonas sp.]
MTPTLASTLAAVAKAMAPATRPWWVIGSAAVALHDVAAGEVRDVDVLIDPVDVTALFGELSIAPITLAPDPLFRSDVFARWTGAGLPVEFMAGFSVATVDGWSAVRPVTRQAIALGAATVYTPDRAELIALLRRFGRPKDLRRAAALEGRKTG